MANSLTVALLGALTAGLVACSANDETPETDQQQPNAKTDGPVSIRNVDEPPQFQGGKEALFKYIRQNVTYPESLEDEGKMATVITSFVIAEDGQVEAVKLRRKAQEKAFNKEAKSGIKAMPNWKPGKVDGEAVRVRYNVPIKFKE